MTTPLRPLTAGELLDTTFSLYRNRFLLFVGLVALPSLLVLPFEIANVVMYASGPLFSAGGLLLWFVIGVMGIIIGAAVQGATFIAVSDVYLGRPVTLVGALSRIRGRIVRLATLTLVSVIGIAIGFVLLIVPGVILALMWSLAIPVAVLENKTIGSSLSRSTDLTKGHRGRVLLIWVLFLVLTYIVTMLFEIPAVIAGVVTAFSSAAGSGGIGAVTMMPGWVLILNVVTTFVSRCLVGPLLSIALAVLYYDLRVRKEAFDLQVMMEAFDRGAAAPGQSQA